MKDIRSFFKSKDKDKSSTVAAPKPKETSVKKENSGKSIDPSSFYEKHKNASSSSSSSSSSPHLKPIAVSAMGKEQKLAASVKRKAPMMIESDDDSDANDFKDEVKKPKQMIKGAENGLDGIKFYLLGTFRSFTKGQFEEMIKNHGGTVASKPGKGVVFAVIGDRVDIDALEKVHESKCKTIDEKFLLEIIQNGAPGAQSTQKSSSPTTKPSKESDSGDMEVDESLTPKKKFNYREYMQKKSAPAVMEGTRDLPVGKDNCLSGLTFVFTGDCQYISRENAQDLVKRYGGRVTTAPSKKTSYVVVGENPGPSKIEKIEKLQIPKLTEEEFYALIESQPEKEGIKIDYAEKAKELEEDVKKASAQIQPVEIKPAASTSKAVSSSAKQPSTTTSISDADLSQMWTQKYAPARTKDIIGNKSNVEKLESWLSSWSEKRNSGEKGFQHAALLSGPPGIGKTSTAFVVCKSLGYDILEFNASDTRSKKSLDQHVKEILHNKSITQYFGKQSEGGKKSEKHVLLMDEVDGMSSGDRGGMAELISFIKKTRVPIICICNDRNSQKVRSLTNHCLDLRFRRPDAQQVRSRIMTIAYREKLQIQPAAIDQLVQGTQGDIRQILNILSTWKMTEDSLSFDEAKKATKSAQKNVEVGLFDLTASFFGGGSRFTSVSEKLENYFYDYSFVPLMVQENYIKINTDINSLSAAADSISEGDLVEAKIRGVNQSWALAPSHGILSCVRPTSLANGSLTERIDFTSWLGMFSKENKYQRILRDLATHTSLLTFGDRQRLRLDYLPLMMKSFATPLIERGADSVREVIQLLDNYYLSKEDYDVIFEYSLDAHFDKQVKAIPSAVKSTLTRTYNKETHLAPYIIGASTVSKRGASSSSLGAIQADEEAEPETIGDDGDDDSVGDGEADDDISKDKSIKAKAVTSKAKGGAAKGSKAGSSSRKKSSK